MNLDSYTRINPYFDDEANSESKGRGRLTAFVGVGLIVASSMLIGLVWKRAYFANAMFEVGAPPRPDTVASGLRTVDSADHHQHLPCSEKTKVEGYQ